MDNEIISLDELLDPDADIVESDEILEAAIDLVFVGLPNMGRVLSAHLKETANVYRAIHIQQRNTFYYNHWGYQPKNIPLKHATCSLRRKGRPCKKRK